MSRDEAFWLPGVSFNVDGEQVEARELSWVMIASCGCTAGMHLMMQDTITEQLAWKSMSGSAQMIKRDKERGFHLKLVKHKDWPFDDCPHSPKWGYIPPPTPIGFVWVSTASTRSLHLVPLTPLGQDEAKKLNREWEEGGMGEIPALCGRNKSYAFTWSKKWYRIDGKVECAHCVKAVQAQCLPLFEQASA